MISAGNYGGTYRTRSNPSRRGPRPISDPLASRVALLSYRMWESAERLARELAPERPADTEEMNEHDIWALLEGVAMELSPTAWDDPDAINDLYELRKKFMGYEDDELKETAKQVKRRKALLPDPSITPENPEFEKMLRRQGVKS